MSILLCLYRAGRSARDHVIPVALVLAAVACTEPRADKAKIAPTPVLEARLDVSDSLARPGAEVRVIVRLRGTNPSSVASVTARLVYDTTGLRFVGEQPLDDGATRAVNALPGLLRFAAVAPRGFDEGVLYAMRFTVLRAESIRSLRLTVDEMHTLTRADATASLIPSRP